MDFTIYKDEIHKNITEIQGFTKDLMKYIEDLCNIQKSRSDKLNSELNVQCKCK